MFLDSKMFMKFMDFKKQVHEFKKYHKILKTFTNLEVHEFEKTLWILKNVLGFENVHKIHGF